LDAPAATVYQRDARQNVPADGAPVKQSEVAREFFSIIGVPNGTADLQRTYFADAGRFSPYLQPDRTRFRRYQTRRRRCKGRSVIRQLIWVLVALLALGIIGLMIVTPTPPKEGQAPPIGIRVQEATGGNGQGPQTR
jgi:hypothetical protein